MAIRLPTLQALSSKTFSTTESIIAAQELTLPELYEYNAINSPQHPLFRFYNGSANQDIVYAEAICGIRKAAHLVTDIVHSSGQHVLTQKQPVIAILAVAGEPHYYAF